jgi:DNA-binding NtrC family response regulator
MSLGEIDAMIDRHEKPYLIIVDDEINFGESLHLALDDAYEVSVTHSVEEARNSFRKKFPDVVLIDMRLPDGDGIDVLRELKPYGKIPIAIVMTACGTGGKLCQRTQGRRGRLYNQALRDRPAQEGYSQSPP